MKHNIFSLFIQNNANFISIECVIIQIDMQNKSSKRELGPLLAYIVTSFVTMYAYMTYISFIMKNGLLSDLNKNILTNINWTCDKNVRFNEYQVTIWMHE